MVNRTSHLPALLNQVLSETYADSSDLNLLRRYAETGDEAAFAGILDRHGPMLLGACRRQVGDLHLAEDVVQATFLVLARKARSIRRGESLAGWLYRVAQRLARKARYAQAARAQRERSAAPNPAEQPPTDPAWEELLLVLDEEMRRLPQRYQSPLLLCYLEGRTQDEAARQLGWSLSTLRRRLERGRNALRGRMSRRGATLGAALFASFLAPSAVRAALSGELRRAVLAGNQPGAVSPAILALAKGELRRSTLTKILAWSAVFAFLSVALAGVAWYAANRQEVAEPPPQTPPVVAPQLEQVKEPRPGHDVFDDPLPKGAAARLGTVTFRHGHAFSWSRSLQYTPDGKHLISLGGGWIRRWDVATGKETVTLGDGWRAGPIKTDLIVTPDGKRACVCVGDDWECTDYDLETGKPLRKYHLQFSRHTVLHGLPWHISPDGKLIADAHGGGAVVWNTDGKLLLDLKLPKGRYQSVVFSPDSKTLYLGDDAHTIHVVDVATGKEQRSFGVANVNGVGVIAVSPDGQWLVTSAWGDGFLRLWNVAKGTEERTFDFPEDGGVGSLLFTQDSRQVLATVTGRGGKPVSVRTWDVATGKPGRAWTGDPQIGVVATIRPDGKVLATMNDAGVIRFWDIDTGQEQHPTAASPCGLNAVAFQADGKTLLTVGADFAVRSWDAATGRLQGPATKAVLGDTLKLTTDGKLLVGDKAGDLATLHDARTGKVLLEAPQGHHAVVSPDGKRLATSSKSGRAWKIETDANEGDVPWYPDSESMRYCFYSKPNAPARNRKRFPKHANRSVR